MLYAFVANNPENGTDPGGEIGGNYTAYAMSKQNEETRKLREAEIWAAIETIKGIIDKSTFTHEEKQLLKEIIPLFVRAADFQWLDSIGLPRRVGPLGYCGLWVEEYDKRTAELKAKYTGKNGDGPLGRNGLFQIDTGSWFNKNTRNIPLLGDAGHTATRITLRDGTVFYLDDGYLGKLDHVFMTNEIPSQYPKGQNLPVTFSKNPEPAGK
ncbi:MAG: hypothetical protein K2R98_15195 [Gemmataceae bacterium]|nr:hypothetical protein [Gemmataceae bacterium]